MINKNKNIFILISRYLIIYKHGIQLIRRNEYISWNVIINEYNVLIIIIIIRWDSLFVGY